MAPQLVAVGGTGHCQHNHTLTQDHHCPIDTVDRHFGVEDSGQSHMLTQDHHYEHFSRLQLLWSDTFSAKGDKADNLSG